MSEKVVALCGCGNIGFRHFQAMMHVDAPFMHLFVIDPAAQAAQRVEDELVNIGHSPHQVTSGVSFEDLPNHVDLGIIATNAPVRRDVFEALTNGRNVDMVLFEKVLFQTQADLNAVGSDLKKKEITGFVNCGRRGFPSYRALRDTLFAKGPLDIHVRGCAYSMASNSIHFLDLAEFLSGASLVSVEASGLHPGHVESKRDRQIEIFGDITAKLSDGGSLRISCDPGDSIELYITISWSEGRLTIDEVNGCCELNGQKAPFLIERVSGMSHLYRDALVAGDPGLTPYAESARQHSLFLGAVRPHLGLSNEADDVCPIS